MSLFLLSIWLSWFVLFFYSIDLRYLWLLPIIFLISFFSYYWLNNIIKVKSSEALNKYSLYITRIIVLIWLVWILNFFGIPLVKICLALISINLALWIWSYIADYKDGKSVFQLWYYLSAIFLFLVWATFNWFQWFLDIFSSFWILNLWVLAFITYIIWIYKEVDAYLTYKVFVFWIWTIILSLINNIPSLYLAICISTVLLTWIFSVMFKMLQHKPLTKNEKTKVSVRRILAWERITNPKKYFNSKFMEKVYGFVFNMPAGTKQSLEAINILLMFSVITSYIIQGFQSFSTIEQFLYWLVIAFFIGNVLILKKIWYNSMIQNLFVFLVINFAIYLSLFSYFWWDFWSVALRWIIRNIASSILIFYAPKFMSHIFNRTDYVYWTISILIAMTVNIFLLLKTETPWELIFFIILLYLGLQGMLIYYALKYVNKLNQHSIEI